MQLVIVILICMTAFGLMLGALEFSRYKKRKTGCCGGNDACGSLAGNTCERHLGDPGNGCNAVGNCGAGG